MSVLRVSPKWESPQTVASFTRGTPNQVLMDFARSFAQPARCLDIGCGAGRNSFPLAALGFHVEGLDWSAPMITAARERQATEAGGNRTAFTFGPMAPLPYPDASFDLIVAHGVWNLSVSDAAFRQALQEAARVAKPAAGLFVFTFSRSTLPPAATPDPGQHYTFSGWNGEPQIFLTDSQLQCELSRVGFLLEKDTSVTEYQRPAAAADKPGRFPALLEARFRWGA